MSEATQSGSERNFVQLRVLRRHHCPEFRSDPNCYVGPEFRSDPDCSVLSKRTVGKGHAASPGDATMGSQTNNEKRE